MGDQPAVEERGGEQVDEELQVCVRRDLAALLAAAEHLEQLLSADSTVVRAHQHAAGARRS